MATTKAALESTVGQRALALTDTEVSTPTTSIMGALDAALAHIQRLNPDVPKALAVVISTGKGKMHGHFAPSTWQDTAGAHAGSARHEILMSSESLARGAEATLTTLIHEAAHALAHAQHVSGTSKADTSRQGRYHNEIFNTNVGKMGLLTEKDSSIGWVTTGLNTWAQAEYANTLAVLAAALTTHRKPAEKKPTKKTTVRVTCDCEYPVTVPIKWWEDFGQDNMTCASGCDWYLAD